MDTHEKCNNVGKLSAEDCECPNCQGGNDSRSSVCSEAVAAARKVPEDGLADCLFWTESYLAEIKRRMNQNTKDD